MGDLFNDMFGYRGTYFYWVWTCGLRKFIFGFVGWIFVKKVCMSAK